MKIKLVSILFLLISVAATPATAATTYKLTMYYEMNLSFVFPEYTADSFVEQLDSGEQTCEALMMVAYARQSLDESDAGFFILNDRYSVKNESGKTISSGKFKAVYSHATGNYVCRVSATISLPKASFYSILDKKGNLIIDSLGRNEFSKKNTAVVDVLDY